MSEDKNDRSFEIEALYQSFRQLFSILPAEEKRVLSDRILKVVYGENEEEG